MLVNAPIIAALKGEHRSTASRRIKRGVYGPVSRRRGKSHWVSLDRVEEAEGLSGSREKVAAMLLSIVLFNEADQAGHRHAR
jgi:hypothetical protein